MFKRETRGGREREKRDRECGRERESGRERDRQSKGKKQFSIGISSLKYRRFFQIYGHISNQEEWMAKCRVI